MIAVLCANHAFEKMEKRARGAGQSGADCVLPNMDSLNTITPWRPERYEQMLRIQVRHLHRDPRIRVRTSCSDIVQETLLRAHQNLAQFQGTTEAELIQWLRSILTRVLITKVRENRAQKCDVGREIKAAVAQSSVLLENFLHDRHGTPSEEVVRQETRQRILEAVDQLPDDQRDVFILREIGGLKVAEVAVQLNKTRKSVAGLLDRARVRLRELLPEYQ
jgi:RNA polymerase sigma-70 factor (ECF subfamily)